MTTIGAACRGYAICTVGRSGSTWLAELLSGTGALGHPSEYFSTEFQRYISGPTYPVDRQAQVAHVLRAGATANGIYGFKIFPIHFDAVSRHLSWTEAFPDLHFIHWRRRDALGQALSRVRAFQTEQWRSTLLVRREPFYNGPAIFEALQWTLLQDARWELYFARNGIVPLRLVYEDALVAAQATVDAVAALLKLSERPKAREQSIEIGVQRDALTDEWRERFLAEYADQDVIDDF